ncbi:MAG TPA: hypothetical protein VF079_06140 [Sphingomicrobium sp.]
MEFERPFRSRRSAAPLGEYRLYFMDSVDHRISRSFEFEADSDAAAIRLAVAWREGRPVELWRGAQKLRSWDRDPA